LNVRGISKWRPL